tara:strand:+ start:2775 stop:3089 length:315 start_codon:yes stop_codon:yes gene_type:complete
MAINYICDNAKCERLFQIDDAEVYCAECEAIHKEWEREYRVRSDEEASEFANQMAKEKQEFFAKRTPARTGTAKGSSGSPSAKDGDGAPACANLAGASVFSSSR